MTTTSLRRAALVPALMLLACGESTGPATVASVAVSPTAVTLAVGQTVSLAATPSDGQGNALVGRDVTWSSGTESVATVNASGVVTGVSAGPATITATAEGVSGDATVTVLPPPVAAVSVLPDQVSLLPGETTQLTATALDAQDNVLLGHTFTWVSDDVSVATVDATGLVTSLQPGNVTVFAASGGRSGSSAVRVDDPDAARVLSVAPAEIVEGQPATITGENFSAVDAENVVTINGVRATVTGATPTMIDIVVPPLECRPRHLADVAVTVGVNTSRIDHPARPGAFFQLAQGQLTLLQDPAAYCLQFDETATDEEYLIGVQSTVEDPTSVTFVQVTGEGDPGAQPAQLAPPAQRAAPNGAPLDPDLSRMLVWRAREAEVMRREMELLDQLPRQSLLSAPGLVDPPLPGDIAVGTPVTLRYPDLDFANTCTNYVEIDGTVRHVGTHAIWVSDDENPANGYEDGDYVTLADQFDDEIYPIETDYFGLPSDIDTNGRIVVVVTKEVNDDGIGGIVPGANLASRAQCSGSNEGEYFFMFSPDPEGEYEFTISVASSLIAARAITGHEFVHNIHVSRRVVSGLDSWRSWQHEGQATLGEEILGHGLNPGREPGQNYGWAVVSNNPLSADRAWYLEAFLQLFNYFGWGPDGPVTQGPATKRANAPEDCTWIDTPGGTNAGTCADRGGLVYGVTWSFLRWLTDQYADDFPGATWQEREGAMHRAWIDGQESGFASIEALVGEPIEELLARWAATLYLDDRVGGLDPLLTLPSYDMSDIEGSVVPEAHLTPRAEAFGDFSQSVQIRGASAAYFRVSGADRPSTAVRMRAPTGGFVSPSIQVWIVRVR